MVAVILCIQKRAAERIRTYARYSGLEISDRYFRSFLGSSCYYVVYFGCSVLCDYFVAFDNFDTVGCCCCSGLGISEQLVIISNRCCEPVRVHSAVSR